ncbi:MAG: hypothetical protein WA775_03100 [Psychroserpens sp.]|uniref:hypothetical protein n=1 Tax=Psychroserpens sp. TaxID=2020870 RepID=UPI003C9E329C
MTFNNVYIVQHLNALRLVLPTFLRKPKMIAYLGGLIKPSVTNYEKFIVDKDDAIYRVSHNGSVTRLQKVLNDKFDNAQRRIYILNVQRRDAVRLYNENAEKEVGLYTPAKNALRSSFNTADGADFTVHIPIEFQNPNNLLLNKFLIQLRAQIDYYKLFAKQYRIEWIE